MQPGWNLQHGRLLVLALCSFLFVYLILALTEIGSGSGCHWAFPRWFGCVLGLHETLAAGLIGAAGVLIAAWMAWTAVQRQINAERQRTVADRKEAERLLAEDLTNYADGGSLAGAHSRAESRAGAIGLGGHSTGDSVRGGAT